MYMYIRIYIHTHYIYIYGDAGPRAQATRSPHHAKVRSGVLVATSHKALEHCDDNILARHIDDVLPYSSNTRTREELPSALLPLCNSQPDENNQ